MSAMQIKRIAAFAAVYLLWGGSYLAIRQVVEVAPPMFAAAVRYGLGGAILLVISLIVRRETLATRRQLVNCMLSGTAMIVAGYAIVFWAATQLPSWMIALLVSSSFLWTYLGECFLLRSEALRVPALAGVLLGLAGIPLLSGSVIRHGQPGSIIAMAGTQLSTIAWSAATLAIKRIQMPKCPFQTAGVQLSSAGLMLAAISCCILDGKKLPAAGILLSPKPLLGMAYLVLGGSVIAFGAFHWLMQRESPSLVAAFAYLNPIVAMILGIGFAHERCSATQLAGAAAILMSVVLVWEVKEPRITVRVKSALRIISFIREPSH
jgi:drug/metabolite transporter (DMT)-like permease